MMMVLLFALRRSKSKEREEGFAKRAKNVITNLGMFWQFICLSILDFIDWNVCVCLVYFCFFLSV